METLLNFTLFGSAITFFIALVFLFFILIYVEANEKGPIGIIAFLCFLGFNYLGGNVSIFEIFTLKNIGLYISIGFVFAIVRTYFKGRELKGRYFDLKSSVFRWWFLFPISAINWVFGKLLRDFYSFIYSKFQKFFEFIFHMHHDKRW